MLKAIGENAENLKILNAHTHSKKKKEQQQKKTWKQFLS